MTIEIKHYTKEEAINAFARDILDLASCPLTLRSDEEVVMAALKLESWYFKDASDEFKSNKDFILKALNENVYPDGLIAFANILIQSDIEILSLAIEKSYDGKVFCYAQGELVLNKELAAKALVKWSIYQGKDMLNLWDNLHPTLQAFFPKDCWHEKAQSYLYQLEQEKQAELVSGGSKDEDGVVW